MKNLSSYGIFAGIATFLLPFVFSNKLFYQSVNAKAFFVYGIVLVFLILFGIKIINNPKIQLIKLKNNYLLWSALVLIAIYFLSTFLGVNSHKSLFSDISRGTGVLFVFALMFLSYIFATLFKKEDWSFVFKSIVFSSVLISFFNILSIFFVKNLGNFFSSSGKLLGNSTFAGTFLFFGISFTIFLLFKTNLRDKKFWFYFVVLLIQIFNPNIINYNILSGGANIKSALSNPFLFLGDAQASSGAALLLLFSALVFYILIRIKPEIKYKKIINWFSISLLVIVSVSVSMLFVNGSKIQQKYINNSSGARLIVWSNSLKSFQEKPIIGWGPENFDLAIQKNIDQKLFFKENLNEVWFDRAHNVFIDTLVDTGVLGLVAWVLFYFVLLRVFYKAYKSQSISYINFIILCFIVLGNILQLQTSFHNITTYYCTFLLLGYGLYLGKDSIKSNLKNDSNNLVGLITIFSFVFAVFILYVFFVKELPRQRSLFKVFQGIDVIEKEKHIKKFSNNGLDFEPIRISSLGMVKGLLIQMGNNSITKEGILNAKKELVLYSGAFEKFIAKNPNHYRAKIDLAYIYFTQTILGDNKTKEAEAVIKEAYKLSPQNPITYQMDALSLLYRGKLKEAEAKSKEGLDMNPDINLSKNVYQHIKEQEKTFPEIAFLKLENL